MNNKVHPVIRRYADGEISAMRAASILSGRVSVADVIVAPRQAGLKPLPDQARAELALVWRVLGLDRGLVV